MEKNLKIETLRFEKVDGWFCGLYIIAFLESTDYESAIRLTISLRGDADTMGAITGGIAEAYYGGVPTAIREEVLKRLPDEFVTVMREFSITKLKCK